MSREPLTADHHAVPRDSVDALLASWDTRRPDLDFSPVGVIARLARVRGHIDVALDAVFAEHGLGAANFGVLVTLTRVGGDDGVSQKRLMDELGLTSGTVSVRVDRLVDEGLVERRVDPASKRTTLISLTGEGRRLFERVVPAHLANEARLLAALDVAERELLATLLRKLLVEFEGSLAPDDAPLRLGLTIAPAHAAIALREAVGLPAVAALLVRSLEAGSPAAVAGLRIGDLLVRAGGRDLRSVGALYAAIDDAAERGRLRVRVLRGTQEHQLTLRLGDGPAPVGARAATAGRPARGEHRV